MVTLKIAVYIVVAFFVVFLSLDFCRMTQLVTLARRDLE